MLFQVHKARPNSVMPNSSVKKNSVTRANSTRLCPFSDFSIPFFNLIILSSKSGIGSNVAEHHLRGKSRILQDTDDAWHQRTKRIIDDTHGDRLRRIDGVVGRSAATRCDSDHRGSQSRQDRRAAARALAIYNHVLSAGDVGVVIGMGTHIASAVANGLAERIVLIVSSSELSDAKG